MNNYVSSLLTFLFFGAVCCIPAVSYAADEVMRSAGCKTEYFLIKDLSNSYKKKSGRRMQIGKTGNKKAVNLLLDNKIDFAFTCKPINKLSKKFKLDPNAVSDWKSIPIAKDPIVIISNRNNGAGNISTAQLTDIFQGKIRNWQEVGGKDLAVMTAYMSSELESGVVLLFKEFTVGKDVELDTQAKIGDGPSMLGNYVSVTPGAVTFMAFNSYKERYGDILAIDGVRPTRENILNGKYKLTATYYLILSGSDNALVNDFVEYSRSPEGREVIEKNFIPYSE